MIFLSAQPHDLYFQWQVEVLITNFRKFGISNSMHIIVWYPEGVDLAGWHKIQEKYPEVHIFFYKDEGVDLGLYIPQLRPHSIKKHFAAFPYLENEAIFYHDSDIIFNYLPDFDLLIQDEVNWQSDTSGYLDYNYLRSKEIQANMPENEAIQILANIGRN